MYKRQAFLSDDGYLCYNNYSITEKILHKDTIRIPGIHNVENYLAAISAVWGEVSLEDIRDMAENFGGVEHRIEFVRELDGVKWYNDSIATSPTRVLAGLNSFDQKLIVIAGGYDKKIPFEPMAETVNQKVKKLILMGVTAEKIEKAVTCLLYTSVNKGLAIDFPRCLQNKHFDGDDVKVKGQFYKYPHDYPNHWTEQQYMPDALKGKVYYRYGDNKQEQSAKMYWDKIKGGEKK